MCFQGAVVHTHSRLSTYNSTYFLGFTLYNSRLLNLMISLSGERVLNFRFASTARCAQRDRHLNFFHWFYFSFFFGLNTTAHNSFPCEGSVEAAPNRETWTNFHHNTLVYFFVFHLRTAREIDFLCCSGNYAKLPVYEGKLRAGSFLESRLPVKILSSSSSHNSTLTRNLWEICFLPGHDFCWNCGGLALWTSWSSVYHRPALKTGRYSR